MLEVLHSLETYLTIYLLANLNLSICLIVNLTIFFFTVITKLECYIVLFGLKTYSLCPLRPTGEIYIYNALRRDPRAKKYLKNNYAI